MRGQAPRLHSELSSRHNERKRWKTEDH
jgi:hypothetical protein